MIYVARFVYMYIYILIYFSICVSFYIYIYICIYIYIYKYEVPKGRSFTVKITPYKSHSDSEFLPFFLRSRLVYELKWGI